MTFVPKNKPNVFLVPVFWLLLSFSNGHYRLMKRLKKFRFLNDNNLIIITDAFRDMDDELAIQMCHGLIQCGLKLHVVVANLKNPLLRARAVKGLLNILGLGFVPVGVGYEVNAEVQHFPDETDVPFMVGEDEVEKDGLGLMVRILENSDDRMATILAISGLTDLAELLRTRSDLCKRKLKKIALMGGVLNELDGRGCLQIDPTAANNRFDLDSARFVYEKAQELGIPLVVLSRFAAAKAKVPFTFYQQLAATGHPAGVRISTGQATALDRLWFACNEPEGGYYRNSLNLPNRCNRDWFVAAKLKGVEPDILGNRPIWGIAAKCGETELYDVMTLLAGVDDLIDLFFGPKEVQVNGVVHKVIGWTPEEHGVADAKGFLSFVMQSMLKTLEITLPIARRVTKVMTEERMKNAA